jgi:hypothetical protein
MTASGVVWSCAKSVMKKSHSSAPHKSGYIISWSFKHIALSEDDIEFQPASEGSSRLFVLLCQSEGVPEMGKMLEWFNGKPVLMDSESVCHLSEEVTLIEGRPWYVNSDRAMPEIVKLYFV